MLLGIIILLTIFLLLALYAFFSFKKAVGLFVENKKYRIILSIIITIVFMLPAFNMWGSTRIWSLIILHILFIRMITQPINFAVRKLTNSKIWNYIYSLMVIPIVCTVLLFTYGFYNMQNVLRTEYNIVTEKPLQQSYKTALLADIHMGNATDEESIQRVVDSLSEENLDIVMLCGDMVDESTTNEQMKNLFEILGQIKNKYGIYYVYGNHDKSHYINAPNYTEEELVNAIEQNGIVILKDSFTDINNDISLVGRNDRSMPRASIEEIMANVDKSKYVLVMDHQPNEFNEKDESGVDLQVSGHTHGGQIFPLSIINTLSNFCDLNYGIEKLENMIAVVTSGVSGWGYNIRTDHHSEYVIINIEN